MADVLSDHGDEAPVFQLGLALAGAISAGAYTAGVLDFLFQALSEWEEQRGKPGVPNHRVVLKVIAGASAGAIAGALGVIALARGLQRREFKKEQLDACYPDRYQRQKLHCVLPSLDRTWVKLPAMVRDDGASGFLTVEDLAVGPNGEPPVLRSLLNANLLDEIKKTALAPPDDSAAPPPQSRVPFVAERLHIYITISNMRGIPFEVVFENDSHGMQTIGDRIHYVVTGLGNSALAEDNSWVKPDSGISLSVDDLPRHIDDQLGEWDTYGTAALASGAFPVGLASRELRIPWSNYDTRSYPMPVPKGVRIKPAFPDKKVDNFVFQSVDGGVVNNSPFDYAQYALSDDPSRTASSEDVNRAILIVAPFPEPPDFPPEGKPAPTFIAVLSALLPALVNQARFRAHDLVPAVNRENHDRYLIAPRRRIPRTHEGDQVPLERYAIACGLLGGFGGFLDEKFRAHDFQLGRRNCQQFLRKTFMAPAHNRIVKGSDTSDRRVIPLLGSAADPVPLPRWPRISGEDFKRVCDQMTVRLDYLVPKLIEQHTGHWAGRQLIKIGWSRFARSRTIEFVRLTMLADLIRRGQFCDISDETPMPERLQHLLKRPERRLEDVHAIVAELHNPAFDFRTPQGIERKTKLPIDFIKTTLETLTDASIPAPLRTWADDRGYTTFERRPSRFKRWSLVRRFDRWWSTPSVD